MKRRSRFFTADVVHEGPDQERKYTERFFPFEVLNVQIGTDAVEYDTCGTKDTVNSVIDSFSDGPASASHHRR